MLEWENRVAYPGVSIAEYDQGPNYRYYKLVSSPIEHQLLSNITIQALGFNGSTPGPLIIAKEGEWIYLEYENRTDHAHGLHLHGLSKPVQQDGMPEIEKNTPLIKPGETFTYKYYAWQVGTFFYHSSHIPQVTQGMIGPFIILPNLEQPHQYSIPARDYTYVIQQSQIPQKEFGEVYPGTYVPNKFDIHPNFFTLNGKSFADTAPMYTHYGEKLHIRFINKTSSSHSMHIHGHDFLVLMIDGFPRQPYMDDTISIASGQRWEIDLHANNPGTWPVNGTKSFHQSNNGETPGGMITKLIYK